MPPARVPVTMISLSVEVTPEPVVLALVAEASGGVGCWAASDLVSAFCATAAGASSATASAAVEISGMVFIKSPMVPRRHRGISPL